MTIKVSNQILKAIAEVNREMTLSRNVFELNLDISFGHCGGKDWGPPKAQS